MAAEHQWKIIPSDVQILRDLARRQLEIAQSPGNIELRRRWISHNALHGGGPMILAEIGGLVQGGEISLDGDLRCQEEWARGVEKGIRWTIFEHETVGDDTVVEPFINCNWHVQVSGYGVETKRTSGSTEGHMGSYRWEAPLKNLGEDFEKLRRRSYSVDRDRTLAWQAHLEQVFGGILPVRIRGGYWWTVGLTWTAINLIGLESLMLYMCDDPDGLHRLMGFLRDDQLAYGQWLEDQGLLSLNNENDYIGSGSRGHCAELPRSDWKPGMPVRQRDLWVLAESQETVGVSPGMFAEFVFPYQRAIAERFGLTYYGCCEPVHGRWNVIKQLSNLRKVSVSPWCDERFMAEALGREYIYCRKPNPALVSTERFDEDLIRGDLRTTLRAAKGCHVELVMKDVHTLARQPWRLKRWVQIAREACREFQ